MSDLLGIAKDILKNVEVIRKSSQVSKEGYVFHIIGNSNPLSLHISTPIPLRNKNLKVCFKKFVGINSIKNITTANNTFVYSSAGGSEQTVTIEPGIYTVDSDDLNTGIVDRINNCITQTGSTTDKFTVGVDTGNAHSWISMPVGWSFIASKSSISKVLGFTKPAYTADSKFLESYPNIIPTVCTPNKKFYSEEQVSIADVKLVLVNCNLVAPGTSFINGIKTQALRSFGFDFYPWDTMVYEPNTPEYHNVFTEVISDITTKITDQNLKLLDFGREQIAVVIEIIEILYKENGYKINGNIFFRL